MLETITTALLFGISAGFSPGPLTAIIITQTFTYGLKEGLKVACAPLITDLPIILLSYFLIGTLVKFTPGLGIISIIGAAFVGHLAYKSFTTTRLYIQTTPHKANSLFKGALVNLLSPNPYLFWMTVGMPTMMKAFELSRIQGLLFPVCFVAVLVSSKVAIVIIVARFKNILTDKIYSIIMKILGAMLGIFAVSLLKDGLQLLM